MDSQEKSTYSLIRSEIHQLQKALEEVKEYEADQGKYCDAIVYFATSHFAGATINSLHRSAKSAKAIWEAIEEDELLFKPSNLMTLALRCLSRMGDRLADAANGRTNVLIKHNFEEFLVNFDMFQTNVNTFMCVITKARK